MNRLEKMPVPVLPAMVGAATLSNVFATMGFTWIRHLTMAAAGIIILLYIIKIIRFPSVCKGEYANVVPASLYAGFSMVVMILGSYLFEFSPAVGKGVWFAGLIIHAVHLCVFTVRNVILKRNINTFVPSWFVTYNGIMVSCVVGGVMNEPGILTVVTYYGICIYFILLPIMLWRLVTVEVKAPVYHTMAVLLAPCSLCLVSCLNIIHNPAPVLVYILYICVLASLAFIIIMLPKFFSFSFTPGYAGLTFPMAIGIVASTKMAGFLEAAGNTGLAGAVKQISGFQIYLTSMIIGYVFLNFIMMALKVERR